MKINPYLINCFAFCKRRYYYEAILRLDIRNDEMELGQTIHKREGKKYFRKGVILETKGTSD